MSRNMEWTLQQGKWRRKPSHYEKNPTELQVRDFFIKQLVYHLPLLFLRNLQKLVCIKSRCSSMPFIDVENTQMCYEERGSGIPFLIIPGFGLDNHATIATFEPIFEGKGGWWRIYPDMPGTGNTPLTSSITTPADWL